MPARARMDAMEQGFTAGEIDTTRPHPARMYDAYLGGKDNYAADREAVRQVLRVAPELRDTARANRAFLQRAVRFLVGEAGIRQILDIGTGIPTAGNVHQVAGEIAPETRVVYVDNDPIVHVHATALRDALPPGSYLVLSHATADFRTEAARQAAAVYDQATSTITLRGHAEIEALFDGWDLVEPGLVQLPLWRPDGKPPRPKELTKIWGYGGVARRRS